MMEPMSGDILSADGIAGAGDAATAKLGPARVIALDIEGMMW